MYLFLLLYKYLDDKVESYGEQWVRVKRLAYEKYNEGNYKPDCEEFMYLKGRLNYKKPYEITQITIKRKIEKWYVLI